MHRKIILILLINLIMVQTFCNAIGVFKNGKGLFDDEEASLDSIMNTKSKGVVASELIKVYPNPAKETVTIEFEFIIKQKAHFELLDLSGRVVMKELLLKGTKSNPLYEMFGSMASRTSDKMSSLSS